MFAKIWTFKIRCGNMTMFRYLGETFNMETNEIKKILFDVNTITKLCPNVQNKGQCDVS